jgi:hypothetical protein
LYGTCSTSKGYSPFGSIGIGNKKNIKKNYRGLVWWQSQWSTEWLSNTTRVIIKDTVVDVNQEVVKGNTENHRKTPNNTDMHTKIPICMENNCEFLFPRSLRSIVEIFILHPGYFCLYSISPDPQSFSLSSP